MNDTATPASNETAALFDSTVAIVSAFLSGANTPIQPDQIDALISNTYTSLTKLAQTNTPAATETAELTPAVDPRRSVKRDHIICLEDGKKVKMLKRYLMTNFGLTPEAYRAKWSLPADYPMVSPEYSERRRVLAQQIGLGTKGRAAKKAAAATPATTETAAAKRKRVKAAGAAAEAAAETENA